MSITIDRAVAVDISQLGGTGVIVGTIKSLTEGLPIGPGDLAGLAWIDPGAKKNYLIGMLKDLDAIGTWVEESEHELGEILADCE